MADDPEFTTPPRAPVDFVARFKSIAERFPEAVTLKNRVGCRCDRCYKAGVETICFTESQFKHAYQVCVNCFPGYNTQWCHWCDKPVPSTNERDVCKRCQEEGVHGDKWCSFRCKTGFAADYPPSHLVKPLTWVNVQEQGRLACKPCYGRETKRILAATYYKCSVCGVMVKQAEHYAMVSKEGLVVQRVCTAHVSIEGAAGPSEPAEQAAEEGKAPPTASGRTSKRPRKAVGK